MNNIQNIQEFLPLLLPLILAEFILLFVTLHHIFTHEHYKRGGRLLWTAVAIIGMQFIGPILYFLLGKEENS